MTEEKKPNGNPESPEPEEKPKDEKRFSQADLEYELGKRLERANQKAEREKEEAERKAREKALSDSEDWKKLAGEHAETITEKNARIKKLEDELEAAKGFESRTSSLEDRLRAVVKPRLKAVPELFRPFVEGMSVEEQAEWLEKNADKLDGADDRHPSGSRPSPKPSGELPRDDRADEEARLRNERRARAAF